MGNISRPIAITSVAWDGVYTDVADDSDLTYVSRSDPTGDDPLVATLAPLTNPGTQDGHTLIVRCDVRPPITVEGDTCSIQVDLLDGDDDRVIATTTAVLTQTATIQEVVLGLTPAEAASVNYASAKVRITGRPITLKQASETVTASEAFASFLTPLHLRASESASLAGDLGVGSRVDSVRFTSVTVPASVAQWAKHEITLQVSTPATNYLYPYDAAPPVGVTAGQGVTVYATYTDPSANTWRQPAFWARDFSVATKDGRRWQLPLTTGKWYVRFTPHVAGAWTVTLTVQDGLGTTSTTSYPVTVTSATALGFIRVASADTRYFARTTGELVPALGTLVSTPTLAGTPGEMDTAFATYGARGLPMMRTWYSGVYGTAWNEWVGGRNIYDPGNYLPRGAILPFDNGGGDIALTMRVDYELGGDTGWFDAVRGQFWDWPEAIEQSTNYVITVTYRGVGILGPRSAGSYGLVAKLHPSFLYQSAADVGTGTVVTTYGGNNATWGTISGTWNSGSNNFLPRLHVALCNCTEGVAYIKTISVAKAGGAEILDRSTMAFHTVVPERLALDLDSMISAADANNVALKIVLMDKEDDLYKKMDSDGTWVIGIESDNLDGFYDAGRTLNWTRWHMQAWWRYCVARWGYSRNIHSWEYTNEGDPNLTTHWQATDEFAKYLKYTVFGITPGGAVHPNRHLATTSFWYGGIGSALWNSPATYPYVDYADLHAYVATSDVVGVDYARLEVDAAYNHLAHSSATRAQGLSKPWVRGELGFDSPDDAANESAWLGPTGAQHRLTEDTQNWWLHNLLWSCLDSGAMGELYWWTSHINSVGWPKFGIVKTFLQALPLAAGGYVDWDDATSACDNANLRVVGQKNATLRRAHLWVQNLAHTWYNVVNGTTITAQSGTITLSGFTASASYTLTTINTLTGATASTATVTANASGVLSLPVTSLSTDLAFTIDGEVASGYPAIPSDARWVSTTGTDSGTYPTRGTQANPWRTVNYALAHVTRPATIAVKDGTYAETIGSAGVWPALNGTNRVTIMAEHEDQAVFSGFTQQDWLSGGDYVTVIGLKCINAGSDAIWNIRRGNVILQRCTGSNADVDSNSSIFLIYTGIGAGSAGPTLVEECVAYGTGRKQFLCFHSDNVTVRRCFGKPTGWDGREFCQQLWPYTSTFEFYDCRYSTFENCIGYSYAEGYHFFTKSEVSYGDNNFFGNMALFACRTTNNLLSSSLLGHPYGGGVTDPVGTRTRPTGGNNCTATSDWTQAEYLRAGFAFSPETLNIPNIKVYDCYAYGSANSGFSLDTGAGATLTGSELRYCTAVENGYDNNSYLGGAANHCDARTNHLAAFTRSNNAIARVWTGSSVSTAEAGGTGARLANRYVDGTLTSTPLWPFPTNAKILAQTGVDITAVMHALYPAQVP